MPKRTVTVVASETMGRRLPVGADAAPTAVRIGDVVWTSGIFGIEPSTGDLGATPEHQFGLAFQAMIRLLERAGVSSREIGLVTVYIPGPDYRQYINPPWLETFQDAGDRPARKTSHVNLPPGAYVELQAIAIAGGRRQPIEMPTLAHRDPIPNGCRIGDLVFSSVIVAQDGRTGAAIEGKQEQLAAAFANSRLFMETAGLSLDSVCHMLVFLSDFDYQPAMVDEWVRTWPQDGDRPARKTLRYPLGGNTLIQVQLIGAVGGKRTNYEIPGVGHHDPIPMGAKVGKFFFSSGISGTIPGSNNQTAATIQEQIGLCQAGMKTLMEQAGGGLENIGLVTVLIQRFESIPLIRQQWEQLFPDPSDRPALMFIDWRMPQVNSEVQYHLAAII
jgi:2-iminobutanoate/2-iminopropanoate deaminase